MINTPAEPVPVVLNGTGTVKGDVNVVNTPSVSVANTPTVNVGNVPTVKIDSAQTLKVVESSVREPFQVHVSVSSSDRFDGLNSFDVPAGKRLVVEFVSAWLSKPGGIFIEVGSNGPGINLPVQTLMKYANGYLDERYGASQEARLYATGTVRVLSAQNSNTTAGHFGAVTIAGYLIPE